MRKKIIIWGLCLFLGSLIIHSYDTKAREQAIPQGGTLTFAAAKDVRSLNPLLAIDPVSTKVNNLIYAGLVKINEKLEIEPDLAESWEISEDELTITFHLRDGLKFHDGDDLTAEDVKFTYSLAVTPQIDSPYRLRFEMVEGWDVIDDKTFLVVFTEPFSPGLANFTLGILPKHLLEGGEADFVAFNKAPVGAGPFKFVEWLPQGHITLEAFDDYFKGRPALDRVVMKVISDKASATLELQLEGVDLVRDIYPEDEKTIKNKDEYNFYIYDDMNYNYLGLNNAEPLFSVSKVRQALSYAIDRVAIIDQVLEGQGEICRSPVSPSSWAYNPDLIPYPYDPEKAKKLLAEEGWEDTDNDGVLDKDGEIFSFTIFTNRDNKQRGKAAELIRDALGKIGVKVDIKKVPWESLVKDHLLARDFEAVIAGFTFTIDPDDYIVWHSEEARGGFNFFSYSNSKVDGLLEEGRHTWDKGKRKIIYQKIQELIIEDQPFIFLWIPRIKTVVRSEFKGIVPSPLGILWNLEHWYKENGSKSEGIDEVSSP